MLLTIYINFRSFLDMMYLFLAFFYLILHEKYLLKFFYLFSFIKLQQRYLIHIYPMEHLGIRFRYFFQNLTFYSKYFKSINWLFTNLILAFNFNLVRNLYFTFKFYKKYNFYLKFLDFNLALCFSFIYFFIHQFFSILNYLSIHQASYFQI